MIEREKTLILLVFLYLAGAHSKIRIFKYPLCGEFSFGTVARYLNKFMKY